MKQIYFATSSPEKVRSLREAFRRNGVVNIEIIHSPLELLEPRSASVLEIAKKKLSLAYGEIQKPCVVQDSGFFIDSLNGFPRAYVNFALETIGVDGILRLVEGRDRSCRFEHCLAYYDGVSDPKFFSSISQGTLADKKLGNPTKYDLHQIFIPFGESRTLAEMSEQERDIWRQTKRDHYTNDFARWARDNLS